MIVINIEIIEDEKNLERIKKKIIEAVAKEQEKIRIEKTIGIRKRIQKAQTISDLF